MDKKYQDLIMAIDAAMLQAYRKDNPKLGMKLNKLKRNVVKEITLRGSTDLVIPGTCLVEQVDYLLNDANEELIIRKGK